MTLQALSGGGGYDYIQDSSPSSPDEGETWLDTSVNPPEAKVYADVGNGLEWLNEKFIDAINANVDHPLSDIHTDVNNISAGVDWSAKTVKWDSNAVSSQGADLFNISGSGYLLEIRAAMDLTPRDYDFSVDGTTLTASGDIEAGFDTGDADYPGVFTVSGPIRFDSSWVLTYDDVGDVFGEATWVID